LKKGSQFCLSGSQLEWREYEKDDEKRVAYSLVGGNLTLLGNKDDEQSPQQGESTLRRVDVFNAPATDDDIPF
jgi:single-stranded DNA-binding protein